MNLLFQLDVEQLNALNEWKKANSKKHGEYHGQYTYRFTPSKLGTMVVVECNISNEKLNLTNYGDYQ